MNDEWYYGEDGQQRGPVTLDALRERIAGGTLRGDDLVWRAGLPEWLPASRVPELADAFRPAAAPPPSIAPGPPPFVHGAPASQASMASPPPPVQSYATPAGYAPSDAATLALRSRANTSLVLGILSIPVCCCAPIGLVLAILAIVFAQKARGAPNAGTATAGLICGIVGLVLNLGSCGMNGMNTFTSGGRNFNWSQFNTAPTITPTPAVPVLPTTNP